MKYLGTYFCRCNVQVDETKECLRRKTDNSRDTLESEGFSPRRRRQNIYFAKYETRETTSSITLEGVEVIERETFQFLGSLMQKMRKLKKM